VPSCSLGVYRGRGWRETLVALLGFKVILLPDRYTQLNTTLNESAQLKLKYGDVARTVSHHLAHNNPYKFFQSLVLSVHFKMISLEK
jgi:hypothetical protein